MHRQGIVYGITHDVSLKIAIKNHKTPKDVMEYLPVKTDVDEIKAALETEGRTTKAANDVEEDDAQEDDEDEDGCKLPAGANGAAAGALPGTGLPPRTSLMDRSSALSGMSLADKKFWLAFAKRTVAAHIKLFTEPDSSSEVRNLLNTTTVSKVKGIDKEDCVLILFDVKQSGECITTPHLRVPPLRDEQLGKLIGGVLESRRAIDPDAEMLIDGDVLCMFDGGRHGSPAPNSCQCLALRLRVSWPTCHCHAQSLFYFSVPQATHPNSTSP